MPKKILLVDDDLDILDILGINLVDYGYDVRQAEGWRALFKWLNSECMPDLIILDLMIPEFDGFELLGSLKAAHSRYHEIPVIAVSALGEDMRKHVLSCGASEYVIKPFTLDQLVSVIENVTAPAPVHVDA